MPSVPISINDNEFSIVCGEGEEDHLKQLASVLDGKVRQMVGSGPTSTARLLVMSALLLLDENSDLKSQCEKQAIAHQQELHDRRTIGDQEPMIIAYDVIVSCAERLESLVEKFEQPKT